MREPNPVDTLDAITTLLLASLGNIRCGAGMTLSAVQNEHEHKELGDKLATIANIAKDGAAYSRALAKAMAKQ